METITNLMLKEHGRINAMLIDFEKKIKDSKIAKELFSKFKWNLEKHFFVEEKAIFDVTISLSQDEISDIFDLMQEHGKIMSEIKKIENSLLKEKIPQIEELKAILKKHATFEDQIFYPKLDLKLNENQKSYLIERTKEIIKG